jgi:hypothetical protein
MATIGAALTSAKNTSRLSYISALPFNTVFLTYTVTTANYVTTGALAANVLNPTTGVTVVAADCPAGRVLRETGRKLFPEANPGVTTYLVSVYDRITGATGFIDPNSTFFAIYNVDKANFLLQDTDEQVALGPPIFTGGGVTATGNITSLSGIGYTGVKTVTQLTSKSTAVTLAGPPAGTITMNNAELADATAVVFTLNNASISATDVPLFIRIISGGLAANYSVSFVSFSDGSVPISVTNTSGGSLTDPLVLQFAILKLTP